MGWLGGAELDPLPPLALHEENSIDRRSCEAIDASGAEDFNCSALIDMAPI